MRGHTNAREQSDELKCLWALQKLLIREIIRSERKARRTKIRRDGLGNDREAADQASHHLEFFRHLAYSWRCFGDAIAFLYMDKHALKQTLFNTHNVNQKQDAGFIADKSGLAAELSMLHDMLAAGVPALLTDLTTTIRHGDICLMVGSDPKLIEVKTSNDLNSRGTRQKRAIRELTQFFETDQAIGLRGLGQIQRVTNDDAEIVHLSAINRCIELARRNGSSVLSPEPGLHYVVATSSADPHGLINLLNMKEPMVFSLNEMKSTRTWAPYSPFTLSIVNESALYDFIWGDIVVLVVFDLAALDEPARRAGVTIKREAASSPLAFSLVADDRAGELGVSKPFFHRIAFDFTSPRWQLETAIARLRSHGRLVERRAADGSEEYGR